MFEFRIDRSDLQRAQWTECSTPTLQAGEVRFAVERFGLSANNITYADLGDKFSYWQFFPTAQGFGLLPIWGFARVVESCHAEFAIGQRAYGYWPLAQSWVLTPQVLSAAGFVDKSKARLALPSVYQHYQRWQRAPSARAGREIDAIAEARYALLRPLYMTAWLCADFLHDSAFFSAGSVVILSASSKTALALGAALKRLAPGIPTTGFTSSANVEFVRSTGCFDAVMSYDAIEQLAKTTTALVDVAGSASLLARVHQHLNDTLCYSAVLGISHRGELAPTDCVLPGAKPQLFFAPTQVKKRVEQHGPGWIEQHSRLDWEDFLQRSEAWLTVSVETSLEQIQECYLNVLAGKANADHGLGFELITPQLSC